jgi:hypothetical protein
LRALEIARAGFAKDLRAGFAGDLATGLAAFGRVGFGVDLADFFMLTTLIVADGGRLYAWARRP